MMRCERLSIPTSAGAEIALDVYVPAVSKEIDLAVRRPAIVICPGGGYEFLSEREAEPIALRFLPEGFNCFVVWYRVAPNRYPLPQQDVAAAVAWVRAHAEETHTDPDRIAVMGFSAGGHLASTFATHYPAELRPAFQILVYPVISMDETITHSGSRENLIGKNPSKALIDYYSNEKHVNAESPRAFIALSDDDRAVPVENSLRYYKALHRYQIPVSLHIYPTGGHGWGYNESFRFKKAVHDELSDWLRSF